LEDQEEEEEEEEDEDERILRWFLGRHVVRMGSRWN